MDEVKQNEINPVKDYELIARANLAAERLEKANAEMARLIGIQARQQVEKVLGGQTTAGDPPAVAEETPAAYAKRVMANDV